ncbi:hypothetical protein [Roseovarius sp. MBR-6]|jgi:hypothetical protein|uniref:hypothetical protein n=1 Tax=Roseovarius sp. MBR-6 TaxID=3156459 RepID=UPI00339696D2
MIGVLLVVLGIALGLFAAAPELPLYVLEVVYFHAVVGRDLIQGVELASSCARVRAGL